MSPRPKARIIHRALMKTITPRTGSYELVYENYFKALYAIFRKIKVNWLYLILDEYLSFNNGRMNIIYYGEYIMHLLKACEIPKPDSPISTVGCLNARTLALMKLPVAKPPHIISFEEWTQRQLAQNQPQQHGEPSQDHLVKDRLVINKKKL